MPFFDPPRRPAFWLRAGIWLAERITGETLLPARMLSWSPRVALGSGVLESLTPHAAGAGEKRLFKLVRMAASYAAACPFCVDMNGSDLGDCGITQEEIEEIAAGREPAALSEPERLAVRYARQITGTPLAVEEALVRELRGVFTEKQIVTLAGISAQVNYWARLIQALGIPPAGFAKECRLPAVKNVDVFDL